MYSDTDLEDHGFSDNEIRLLRNICQGDHNHKKGDFYEKSFTLHELLSYSTQFSQKE